MPRRSDYDSVLREFNAFKSDMPTSRLSDIEIYTKLADYFTQDLIERIDGINPRELPNAYKDFSRAHRIRAIAGPEDARYALIEKYKKIPFPKLNENHRKYRSEAMEELRRANFGEPMQKIVKQVEKSPSAMSLAGALIPRASPI